jgi:PST family polysaccharide transporter
VSIAQRAVRGAAWTIATSLGSRALGIIGTLVLTRFVAPGDYGQTDVASVVVLTANQLSTIGMGQYVIAFPKAGRRAAFHATFYHLLLGLFAIGAVVLLRNPLGVFLNAPSIGLYVPGLALACIVDRIAFMPTRILSRDMRFRTIGISRTAGEITYTLASVGLAALGWGATAIIAGNIVRSLVRSAMVLAAVDRREWFEPSRIDGALSRDLFRFGVPVSIAGTAGFGSRYWDTSLIAKMFGDAAAGIYQRAYQLADIPAVQIGEQIGDVLLPSFAHMDPEQRKRALVRSTVLLVLIVAPLALGLGAIAPTLISTLLDPRWAFAADMLVVLSVLSVVRPIGWTVASYLVARGQPRPMALLECLKVVVLIVAILALGQLGPLWACAAVGIAFGVHALASLWWVKRIDGIELGTLVGGLGRPLLACVPMVAAVVAVRHALQHVGPLPRGFGLLAELTAGAIVYVPAAFLIAGTASRDLIAQLRGALGKRARKVPPDEGS